MVEVVLWSREPLDTEGFLFEGDIQSHKLCINPERSFRFAVVDIAAGTAEDIVPSDLADWQNKWIAEGIADLAEPG